MSEKKIGAVMVVGGGVAGMQAALDAANSGFYVYLVERSSSIGGIMSQLDKTFPTNDCSMCIISPKLVEVGRHINIELLTLSEIKDISGEQGNFEVLVTQYPRYVDMDKCIACGLCAQKCPKKVDSEYDERLIKRKAIYLKYPQAVPLKYAIDPEKCIFFKNGRCKACEKFCPTGAINFDDPKKDLSLKVGSIILATGVRAYDPVTHDIYGYGKSPNIITSLEFERILSASGPFGGHLVRPSDKKEPKKIAWLQCVGSRDTHIGARGYCSSVCCTYAIKEAMLAKEHSKEPLDTAIFYMDIRTHGKDFEKYYNRGRDETGIRFIKSKISNIFPVGDIGNQIIRYIDENGKRVDEEFDIVVLSVGLGISSKAIELAGKSGVELDHYNFVSTTSFDPVKTSVPGIVVCGAFEAPIDIPTSVIESSAAAGMAGISLSESRWSLTKKEEIPEEIDIRGEPPRIGVFICRCGINIAGVVDVPAVADFARNLPYVVHTEENMFSCSQDTQDKITKIIKEKRLNRVVVSACTPKTHEPLFQETLINAGINKYLFDMANIRNHCSWVHSAKPEEATEKAKELTMMAVAKVALHEPLVEPELEINQSALVIGGGISGMAAAKTLSEQGYHTCLVEKNEMLGGQARYIHETWRGENVQQNLNRMIEEIQSDDKIDVYLKSEITKVDGFVGNFNTSIQKDGKEEVLEHGVTIIASGAEELKPDNHLYGQDSRVLTGLELDRKFIKNDDSIKNIKSALFIQCVGSRIEERPYCSKTCCTHSIKNALQLKELNPEMDIFILYRDMRSYGLREDLYRKAREKGIFFFRYDFGKELSVDNDKKDLRIRFTDSTIKRKIEIRPDLLVLASAIVPPKKNPLAQMYKVTLNDDGFFMEAHVKLRPVDCATDGVFICGLAHAPKPIDESIAQAQAAATRAVTLLAKKTTNMSGTIAYINPLNCSSCGVCINICPFSAPSFIEKGPFTGKAEINSVLCKGCGLCTASCRSGAIHLKGFDNDQIFSQIFALEKAV
ncbi:MAG: CoB--CoM heterodisulfide reductase iron-sulfur subunit A family protein [Desulfobacteraceae bacterium]|nr:CoB--CoM heterodisulfide reductase iron-sulfur subunit A family protein [Desulfobacteraceae bacterium]MBC2718133.1 CoB--CoM heterodisulfide reductase iron-sulfur subunit A family protein [Desulfobacteraceae bacterium]